MPYPESCPECGGAFRNTGTHFTARRNEVGRHVLLELGCQNTTRRFWWDFTTGSVTEDGRSIPARRAAPHGGSAAADPGGLHVETNGHVSLATLDRPTPEAPPEPEPIIDVTHEPNSHRLSRAGAPLDAQPPAERPMAEPSNTAWPITEPATGERLTADAPDPRPPVAERSSMVEPKIEAMGRGGGVAELEDAGPIASPAVRDAFVRQLQLDRLTLRQMRTWLMSEDARRAIEVAAGATEATYERLALILFGIDLPQLLGKQPSPPASTGMTAEERLELQREKARIRARLRRAATKAARQQS